MERVLSLQKEQYTLLKKQGEETRRFRHDLRQRLVAANHYLKKGEFLSTRPGGGIGILSIRSIAEKYVGGCRFETNGSVLSS